MSENNDESMVPKYTEIVNLTVHNNFNEFSSGKIIPTAGIARVETRQTPIYRDPSGFTIFKKEYLEIIGIDLDNIDPNKLYLVSAVVLNAIRDRGITLENIVAPAITIRDGSGNVIGSRDFRING